MAFAPRRGVRGRDWVGAWAESFNATLKNERVYRMVYPTKDKAIKDIASWIELTYNHVLNHHGQPLPPNGRLWLGSVAPGVVT